MEHVIDKIREQFGGLAEIEKRSASRIYIRIDKKDLRDVIRYLFVDLGGRFSTASGVDEAGCMEILYHMSFDRHGGFVTVRTQAQKPELEMDSIMDIVAGAEWIEKEMNELLGIKFKGNARETSFLLPDDWPEGICPFRKGDQGK